MNTILETFLARVRSGEPVAFRDTMHVIAEHYAYQPARFCNGLAAERMINEPGTNEGSCKIFHFAHRHGLSEAETLALFGEYYREDVLGNPAGEGHKNIRTFMRYGWAGIEFDGAALTESTQPQA